VRIFTGIRPRLLAFNLLLVFLPLFGFLYLDVYEHQLLRAQERSMVQQARLLAAALSTGTLTDVDPKSLIENLQGRLDARLRVVDAEGNLLADSSRVRPPGAPDVAQPADAAPSADEYPPEKPAREKFLYRIGAWFYRLYADIFEPPSPSLESAEFYGTARRLDGPEIRAALEGKYGSATRVSASGQRSVTLYSAVPFRRDGRIAGAVLVSQSTYRILQDLYAERLVLFKVVLLSVAVAGLLSVLVAATIARPLRHLRDEAEAILDRRGRLTGGFEGSHRADQIGDLARALQELTRRLDARMQTLETFAADVSHELRNPLTSIRTAAEMAAEVDDPAERRRFREIVQRDIARVERLLAGVRDIASIDARLDAEAKENVPLDRLLAEIVESFNVRERGRVRFRLESRVTSTVRGSTDRVSQIFENLLDNAAGFSPDGAEVVVSLERRNSTAVVRVADRGPGIPNAHVARVFERFFTYRPGDRDEARSDGHSGLGLSIAAAIAEGYGGRIKAANREGGGAVFEVRLPEV
jgi:two-component system sensor histidine kinase ChvG